MATRQYRGRFLRIVTPVTFFAIVLAASNAVVGQSAGAATSHVLRSHSHHSRIHLLTSGLDGSVGSTIGPDGALYVPEGIAGRVTRIDPKTGHTSVFASGLPTRVAPVGGAMDIAFLHHTAYVLVTVVSPDFGGGTSVDGIYRVDGPHKFTVIADIGAYAIAHPPTTDYFIPSGVQFAIQTYRGKFLVTDGHHNRVYLITPKGHISQVETFTDIVPTGLALKGHSVYLAEAGPVPHLAGNGKVMKLNIHAHTAREIASGAPLAVDIEFAKGHRLFALSQGDFPDGNPEGSPAAPDTGALERVHHDGTMSAVATELNQPTSLEFIGNTAYIVTLNGEVWTIPCVSHSDRGR